MSRRSFLSRRGNKASSRIFVTLDNSAKINRHELTGVGEIGGRLTDSRSRENRDELV